jgi:hypothetical protein
MPEPSRGFKAKRHEEVNLFTRVPIVVQRQHHYTKAKRSA